MVDKFNLETFSQKLHTLATDDEQLKQFEPFLQEGDIELYAEPITITTIIEVGSLIMSILDALGGQPDYSEVLDEISSRLDNIEGLLEDILITLEKIEQRTIDAIERGHRQSSERKVLGATDFFIDHASEWKRNLESPENQAMMRSLLEKIGSGARELIYYEYACYSTLGVALAFEATLLQMTRSSVETQKMCYNRYSAYFTKCTNEQESGSITNTRKKYETLAATHLNQYPSRNNMREFMGIVTLRSNARCEDFADVYMITNGSLVSGFSGGITLENQRRECEPIDIGHLNYDVFYVTRSETVLTSSRENKLEPYERHLAQTLATLNKASEEYKNAVAKVEILRKAEEVIADFKRGCDRLKEQAQ